MAFSRAALFLFPLLLGMGICLAQGSTTPNSHQLPTGPSSTKPPVLVLLFLFAVALMVVFVGMVCRNNEPIAACLCKGHSNENTHHIDQTNADCGPVYENVRKDDEHVSRSNFDNPAFVGDQNPRLTQSSDMANSSYVNVPANPTHSHNQMMPTYENIDRRNPGARNLGTDSTRQDSPAPSGEDYSPYEEVGDTGARMPGVGTAAASREDTESAYAGLDPVERSDYLDLRHVGFAHQSLSK